MKRPCPHCGIELDYQVLYPPIPMTIRRWVVEPDDEGQREITFCPECDGELTTDDHSFDQAAHTDW